MFGKPVQPPLDNQKRKSRSGDRLSIEVRDGKLLIQSHSAPLKELPLDLDVEGLIGKGATGQVFNATDNIGRNVAVKVWLRTNRHQPSITRALLETRKLASLGTHPLFAIVHQFGIAETVPYSIMERVTGTSVTSWLQQRPPLSQRLAVWEMFSYAIHKIYQQETLHGDPHTGNIIVFDDPGRLYKPFHRGFCDVGIKLLDLGTSYIWSSAKDLRARESRVLVETCGRLLGTDEVRRFADLQAINDPRATLETLDLVGELYRHVPDPEAANLGGPVMCGDRIAEIVAHRPVLDLDGVLAVVSKHLPTAVPEFLRRLTYLVLRMSSDSPDSYPTPALMLLTPAQEVDWLRQNYQKWQHIFRSRRGGTTADPTQRRFL
jgi:serine/threonine protein kinase